MQICVFLTASDYKKAREALGHQQPVNFRQLPAFAHPQNQNQIAVSQSGKLKNGMTGCPEYLPFLHIHKN